MNRNKKTSFFPVPLETIDYSVILTDMDGNITNLDKAAQVLFGYSSKELIGKNLRILYSERNSPEILEEIRKKIDQKGNWEAKLWKKKKNAQEILCYISTSYLIDEQGKAVGSIEVARETHESERTKEELTYMAQLLESAAYCIISTDPKGIIKSINKAGEKMLRYKAEELIGKHVSIIQSPSIPQELMQKLDEKAKRGENWETESLGVKKDGTTFPIWLATSYLFDEEGKIKSTIGISRDITREKEFEERDRYMAQLLESAAYCIISTDPKGIIKSINKAGEKMLGYKAEELIGKHVSIIQSPRIPQELMKKLDEKAKRGENWETESLGIRKDGTTFPVWLANSYLFDEEGKIKSAIGISRDTTREKEAEEKLRYMAQLLESAAYCIISTDPKGIIKSVNKAGEKMLRYKAEELIGKHVSIIQSPSIPQELMQKLDEKAKRGENWETESLGVKKDGTTFPIWLATSYLFDEEGKIKSTIGISRDITREKEVEERDRYMAQLLESAAHSITSTDANNIIRSVNRAAEKLYGYRADELIGKHVDILFSDKNPLEYLQKIKEDADKGRNWEAELWRKKKNGDEILIWISTSYILDENGKIKTKVSIERDITEVKQMEEELIHSSKLAGLGEMAAGIAHEIKNPLTGVSLGLEKLENALSLGTKEAKVLNKVLEDIDRINEIVSRLLDLSRKKKPEMEVLDINDIIKDVLLNIGPLAKQENIEVVTNLNKDLIQINADGGQLYQVFLNLGLNAIQAMPNGGTLAISTDKTDSDGEKRISISFVDSGIGISKDNIRKIFEPFFSSRKGGTGLGMSISHRIVKDHGGSIEIESEPGKGTEIKVLLTTYEER